MLSDADNNTHAALERELMEAFAKLPQPTRDVAVERFADLIHISIEAERTRPTSRRRLLRLGSCGSDCGGMRP